MACGRGQILTNIGRVLSQDNRSKIVYRGFDVVQGYCLQAERIAKEFFPNPLVQVCEIDKFELHLEPEESFDAITLTNTVHEITPEQVAATFASTLCRVSGNGIVFMYDMESLPTMELGAIPWLGKEIEQVVHRLLLESGESTYRPTVATWPHRSCVGWNLQLNRSHLTVPPEALQLRRAQMVAGASGLIRELLGKRLSDVHQALSTASRYAERDGDEQADVQRLLYDYWAISRALGLPLTVPTGVA